jgi:hypothetical protein
MKGSGVRTVAVVGRHGAPPANVKTKSKATRRSRVGGRSCSGVGPREGGGAATIAKLGFSDASASSSQALFAEVRVGR